MSCNNNSGDNSVYDAIMYAAAGAALAYSSVGAFWMLRRCLRMYNDPISNRSCLSCEPVLTSDNESHTTQPPPDSLSTEDMYELADLKEEETGCCWSQSKQTIDRQWMGAIKQYEAEQANQGSLDMMQYSAGLISRLNWIRRRSEAWKNERRQWGRGTPPMSQVFEGDNIPPASSPSTSRFLALPEYVNKFKLPRFLTPGRRKSDSSISSTEV